MFSLIFLVVLIVNFNNKKALTYTSLRLCLRVWRGRKGRALKKGRMEWKKIKDFGGFIFIHNTKFS